MKSVTIIGCAESWKDAPLDGESWGITSTILKRPVSRVFDMHDLLQPIEAWVSHYLMWLGKYYGRNYINQKAEKRKARIPNFFEEVKRLNVPLYSIKEYPEIPGSIRYPIEHIKGLFPYHPFSGTFDYAVAMAIAEEYERIDIYGVQLDSTDEYAHQLCSANYWLGLALGTGITVEVHGDSMLLKSITKEDYGYPRSK